MLVIVPLLLVTLVLMVVALPRVLGTAWDSVVKHANALAVDWAGGDVTGIAIRLLAILAVCLPVVGSLIVLARLVKTVIASLWRRTAGHPGRRAVAGLLVLAVAAGLAWSWWPNANRYRPVQPFEKGTVVDGLQTASFAGRTPPLADGQIVEGDRSVWASTSAPPTKDHPELALVLVPKAAAVGSADPGPTWVFPFNRPGAPGAGDNQALAVNTTDGSTLYDVAFALVWAEGSSVPNSNEAYAFASCRGCETVAVAFQVVLITGDAHVAIPQNVSGAVNYSCVQCVTYALAQQLVLSVPGDPSPATKQRLDALWQQITTLASTIEALSLDQVRPASSTTRTRSGPSLSPNQPRQRPARRRRRPCLRRPQRPRQAAAPRPGLDQRARPVCFPHPLPPRRKRRNRQRHPRRRAAPQTHPAASCRRQPRTQPQRRRATARSRPVPPVSVRRVIRSRQRGARVRTGAKSRGERRAHSPGRPPFAGSGMCRCTQSCS